MKYLFSIYWKDYRIGFVFYRKNKFAFLYDKKSLDEAAIEGFDKLIGFPNIDEIYISDKLFTIFESRIKSNERLKKENIKSDKIIDNLINSNGKLLTDKLTIRIEKEYTDGTKHI